MKILLKKQLAICLVLCLLTGMLISFTSCGLKVKAENLMVGFTASKVTGNETDITFIANTANFSVELFKKCVAENNNSLISPLSVLFALSMTANGADGKTLLQMENLLGSGMSIDELNKYLYTYLNSLPSEKKSKLQMSNSIWFNNEKNRLTVEPDFLQKNADYYGADAFSVPFDNQTLKDINDWIKDKTNGLIDNVLDEIPPDAVMYLINTILFDAEWKNVYEKNDIDSGTFNAYDKSKQKVEMMHSTESFYIENESATGFIKPYANDSYSFVALLPNEDISINDYIASLTGNDFIDTISKVNNEGVIVELPKFKYDYSIKMNYALNSLGIKDAFNEDIADFSKLGHSTYGNIYISRVLHKTYISVDELGTKAGAAAMVEMYECCEVEMNTPKTVILDRPFVYAIIDNTTSLPIFIGSVLSIEG